MELKAKITAKITPCTFDGVPGDTAVTIFMPGVKIPLKAMLSDIEIEGAAQDAIEELKPITLYSMPIYSGSIFHGEMKPQVDGSALLASLKEAIPGLGKIRTGCPDCENGNTGWSYSTMSLDGTTTVIEWKDPVNSLTSVIMHLNDQHKWSREAIADWIETKDWDLQFVTPVEEKVL